MPYQKRKWRPISNKLGMSPYFTCDYPHEKWQAGDWILFHHIDGREGRLFGADEYRISDPILAVFVGFSVWDQALVLNYVEPVPEMLLFTEDPKVENIALWADNVFVRGHWRTKPSFRQLKGALSLNMATGSSEP